MSLFDLTDRAIVVTGGAGHLGRHICAGLANAGANVLCASSRIGEFDELLDSSTPGLVMCVVCDVSDGLAFEKHVAAFRDKCGRLDGLINNAVRAPRGINLDMPTVQFSQALAGVLTHYFTCSRIARRYMKGPGSIINMASMWGVISPSPEMYPQDMKIEPSIAMPAAAGGILGMTRYLAVLMAKDNVRVNAVVPGWFPKKRGPDREDYMAKIVERVPLGRIGRPEEIVGAVIFLLSGASSYVTGHQLVVDGGYTIR